jgi:hypothetical protein
MLHFCGMATLREELADYIWIDDDLDAVLLIVQKHVNDRLAQLFSE